MITHKTTLVVKPNIEDFGYNEELDEFYCPPKDKTYMRIFFNDLVLVADGPALTTTHETLLWLGGFVDTA